MGGHPKLEGESYSPKCLQNMRKILRENFS